MKYAVITYIFGKNKEILREPLVVDKDVEYICVTDQKDLKSKIWKIVYDDIPEANCTRDKMVYVKYRPFKYTNADIICAIDGSILIKHSLKKLFEQIKNNEVLVKLHPERNNILDELYVWNKIRNLSIYGIEKFKFIANKDNINLKNNFLIESCVLVYKNDKIIKELCENVIAYMKFLGENNMLFLTNQCTMSLLIQKFNIKYDIFKQRDYFVHYCHGSTARFILD